MVIARGIVKGTVHPHFLKFHHHLVNLRIHNFSGASEQKKIEQKKTDWVHKNAFEPNLKASIDHAGVMLLFFIIIISLFFLLI